MTWTIEYSRNADRFIHAEGIQGEVKNQTQGFLRKLRGKSINVDVKKLRGNGKVILESGREGSESYFPLIPATGPYTSKGLISAAMRINETFVMISLPNFLDSRNSTNPSNPSNPMNSMNPSNPLSSPQNLTSCFQL